MPSRSSFKVSGKITIKRTVQVRRTVETRFTSHNSNGFSMDGTSTPRLLPPVHYNPGEEAYLNEIKEAVSQPALERLRDAFLCHAWPDRNGAATELYGELKSSDVDVWFSERDVVLGEPMMRQIDRGLASSKVGIVLVTPSFLGALQSRRTADKELSVLLAGERVVPVLHGIDFDELNAESPFLASRAGLSTKHSSLKEVAYKIASMLRP